MADRCTGHCCRLFYLPRSPFSWQHLRRKAEYVVGRWGAKADQTWHDTLYIADMIVHVHTLTHPHSHRGQAQHPVKGSRWYYYTCRHFDGVGCRAYDRRPRMCSEYPYGHVCQYPSCTWHNGKYPHVKNVGGTRVVEEMLNGDLCGQDENKPAVESVAV